MATFDIIVDTSALVAFFLNSDANHGRARDYVSSHRNCRWVVLESVFGEAVTWFRMKTSPKTSIDLGRVLRETYRYVSLSDEDHQAIWGVFCQYDDKMWSYVDCSILVMARRPGVPDVFTFDRHLAQMSGLGILPRP